MPTYRCTFDRIGRNKQVSPLLTVAENADQLEDAIHAWARPMLASSDVEVSVHSDSPDEGPTRVTIYAGFHNVGTGTIREVPTVRYPHITVRLTGENGNAFAVIGAVNRALRLYKVPEDQRAEFTDQAMAGDYTHLLRVCGEWVTVQ